MSKYTAEQGGVIIFEQEIDSTSSKDFPAEFRDRPADGELPITLKIDEEIVGVQHSLEDEARIEQEFLASPEGQVRRQALIEEAAAFNARVQTLLGDPS